MVIKTFEYQILNNFSSNVGTLEKKEFSLEVADKARYVIHRAIRTATRNHAQYTSSTKTKSEVRGGGRKPWKQKGTGNARAGSKRSPLWRGGGVTFGPKPRIVNNKINKKEKKLALRSLLFNKHTQMFVFNKFEIEEAKTTNFITKLGNLDKTKNTLVISSTPNVNLYKSIKNLEKFEYILANQLNVTDLAKANQIFIDDLSFDIIKETYCDNRNK
jgi:large subunit ribosomal protein L4